MDTMNYLESAEAYYNAMLASDFKKMAAYLNEDAQFIGPLAQMKGRDNIIEAAKNLVKMLEKIEFRERFASENKVVFIYDFIFPQPLGLLRSAGCITFENSLISVIEVFYDGAQVMQKREAIFN